MSTTNSPENSKKLMENLVDAFLYLGPQDLRVREQIPADIALDEDYERELQRRMVLQGFPGAGTGSAGQIVASAEDPLFRMPTQPSSRKELSRTQEQ